MYSSKGLEKVIRMLGPETMQDLADVHENELQRFKVSPPSRRNRLSPDPDHPSTFFSLTTIFRTHSSPPIAGCFEDDKSKGNIYIYIYSVTQGDKFASPGAKSFLSNPAGVVYHNAEFFKAYYKFFSLENRSVHFTFDKLFHIIIGHFDKIKCPIDPRRKRVEVNMCAT